MDGTTTLPLETVSLLLFSILLMAYIIFCLIFHYHWQAYSIDAHVTTRTYYIFFAVSLPLLLICTLGVFIL